MKPPPTKPNTPAEIIYGIHAVTTLLKQAPQKIIQISLLQDRRDQRIQNIEELAIIANIPIQRLNKSALEAQLLNLDETGHQGVTALIQPAKIYNEQDLNRLLEQLTSQQTPVFLLILDGVQDPHNLGACLRTAATAGVHAIIAPKNNSATLTPTVRKVASGAAEIVPFIQITNLARTIRDLQGSGVWIYGADCDGTQSIYKTDFTPKNIALVLGAEGSGLRRLTKEHCDVLFQIPMQSTISSLNVSVATGICLFEAIRQRLYQESNSRE